MIDRSYRGAGLAGGAIGCGSTAPGEVVALVAARSAGLLSTRCLAVAVAGIVHAQERTKRRRAVEFPAPGCYVVLR